MGSSKSGPSAPNPKKLAKQQSRINRETALTQYGLNATDQVNPWGSIGYEQIGTWDDGTPRFRQTTSLSPEQRGIFDAGQEAQFNLAGIARDQSALLRDHFANPFTSSASITGTAGQTDRIGGGFSTAFSPTIGGAFSDTLGPGYQTGVDLATTYAGADDFSADRQRVEDALWERTAGDRAAQESALTARLANQGIRPGSAAYNFEMERLARQTTDARLATILAGGQEQSRLVGLARDAASFGNDATLAGANFGNRALLDQGVFGNDAALKAAQFGSQQQQNQNAAALDAAGFGNDARMAEATFGNNAALQQFAMDLQRRGLPLSEISALAGLTQVGSPSGMSGPTPQVGVDAPDYAGMVQQQYQQQMREHQARLGGIGGIFGTIAGAALGGPFGASVGGGIGGLFGRAA